MLERTAAQHISIILIILASNLYDVEIIVLCFVWFK